MFPKSVVWGAVLLASSTCSAYGTVLGWSLTVSGDQNVPVFDLTNTSDPGFGITAFQMTIGNTAFNFDSAVILLGPYPFTVTLHNPDTNESGGIRASLVDYSFGAGFSGGLTFRFEADVDEGNANNSRNYRTVMFNNGDAPNSVVTVTFSSGHILSKEWPDASATLTTYTLQDSLTISDGNGEIPEPATWGSTALAALFLGVLRGRLRRR